MAGRVEALALLVQARRVELGEEDPLLLPERSGKVRAVRRENRGTAPPNEFRAFWNTQHDSTYARDSRAMCCSRAAPAAPSSVLEGDGVTDGDRTVVQSVRVQARAMHEALEHTGFRQRL